MGSSQDIRDPIAAPRQVEVTAQAIRRFAQAIGDDDPLYHDAAYAASTRHGGIVAPPLFCQSLAYDDLPPALLPPDGSPRETAALPVPAQRLVGGSSDYRIERLVRPGDVITVTTRPGQVTTKTGRSGTLYLIEVETVFTDAQGALVARERATYIKR
jgi:acyl dehydratase